MAELRVFVNDDGLFIQQESVTALLRHIGREYLEHVPAHVDAGEFIEAALDRHADFILGRAADDIEALKAPVD